MHKQNEFWVKISFFMSIEDILTLSRFHLWRKINFGKSNLKDQIIVSNYVYGFIQLLKDEQKVNAALKQKQSSEVFY